jgi:hypothetical protein
MNKDRIGDNELFGSEIASRILNHLAAADLYPGNKPYSCPEEVSVTDYHLLVKAGSWIEERFDAGGKIVVETVQAEIWSEAIQKALNEHLQVRIPMRSLPYYLDVPLVVRPGQWLLLDQGVEMRLKPHSNCSMVHNRSIESGKNKTIVSTKPDENIRIQGGTWTTLAIGDKANGNTRGRVDCSDSIPGAHGCFLFHNVRNLHLRDITVKQSLCFGIHLGNCSDVLLENLTFENHQRDGVHVDGPAEYIAISQVKGETHDDLLSFTAWDWSQYSVSFGSIHHVLAQNIEGASVPSERQDKRWFMPDGRAEIRLLPGVKKLADSTEMDCTISQFVFRNIQNLRHVKIYPQPNRELGVDRDFSETTGRVRELVFSNIHVIDPSPEGTIQVACEAEDIVATDVVVDAVAPIDVHWSLIKVAPLSGQLELPNQPPQELFHPERNASLRNYLVDKVFLISSEGRFPATNQQLVSSCDLKDNILTPVSALDRGGKASLENQITSSFNSP